MTSIDLREQYIDLPPQPVITRDNVTINVDSVVYWQITDPIKAVYEVTDLVGGIVQLTITGMRAVMGEMDLDHTLSNRDQINAKLRIILDEATDKWGVKVTRVDVKNINPPEDVRITMEKQMTAERNRRASDPPGRGRQAGCDHACRGRKAGRRYAFRGKQAVRDPRRRRCGAGSPHQRCGRGSGDRTDRRHIGDRRANGAISDNIALHRFAARHGAHAEFESDLHADGNRSVFWRASGASRKFFGARAKSRTAAAEAASFAAGVG